MFSFCNAFLPPTIIAIIVNKKKGEVDAEERTGERMSDAVALVPQRTAKKKYVFL